jgi:signal transduction histidine kinase
MSPLPFAGLIAAVVGVLGWLLLVFATDRSGQVSLPDAAGSTVEYLIDHEAGLARPDLERQPAEAWHRSLGDGYLTAAQGEALWLRVTLRNPGGTALHGVVANADYYFLDELDGWIRDGAEWTELRTGEAVPLKEKALAGRDAALPVSVPAHGETVIYLRAHDFFTAFVWPVWWPRQAAFQAAQTRGLLAEGIYLGGLLALLAYNAALWLRLRLADTGYYVLYLGTVAIFMGLTRALLPALGGTFASPMLETSVVIVIALSGFFLTQFARTFLELAHHLPRADRVARAVGALLLVVAGAGLTTPWLERAWTLPLTVVFAAVVHVGLMAMAVQAWRAGLGHARFFVGSFGCLFAGTLWMSVISFGHQATRQTGIMGMMIGSALEMLLLSLAVADRFVRAQQEKTAAQARLVEETEQRRAIEEAYADELALEVGERTRELEAANADKDRMLTVVGHDLRGPLTALTQAAEQAAAPPADPASLGKFTGEAAVVGRQVLLLIEDLVLWARLRAGRMPPAGRHRPTAIVAPVIALHRAAAGQRGVKLTVAVPDDVRVLTDLVLAQTLLRNLVANALKFARTEVIVSAQLAADGVQLTVSDDGPGLPPAVLAAFAAQAALPGADNGLGLRLCVEIGRALGVKLGAVSVAGRGTEFKFILPAVGGESDA